MRKNRRCFIGHRRRALGKKDVPTLWLLAVETAKIADLAAAHRVHTWHSVLDAPHVEEPVRQVDLIPAQRAQLGWSKPVPICDENHRRVAVPVPPVLARRFPEQLDFLGCQVRGWRRRLPKMPGSLAAGPWGRSR